LPDKRCRFNRSQPSNYNLPFSSMLIAMRRAFTTFSRLLLSCKYIGNRSYQRCEFHRKNESTPSGIGRTLLGWVFLSKNEIYSPISSLCTNRNVNEQTLTQINSCATSPRACGGNV